MAANAIAGTLYVKIDGTQYPVKGKFKYSPLTSVKTGVAGADGPHGFNVKPKMPSVKGTLTDLGRLSVSQLQSLQSSTLTLELVNGKTFILSQAFLEGDIEVDTDEGEYEVEFKGMSAIEQVAT